MSNATAPKFNPTILFDNSTQQSRRQPFFVFISSIHNVSTECFVTIGGLFSSLNFKPGKAREKANIQFLPTAEPTKWPKTQRRSPRRRHPRSLAQPSPMSSPASTPSTCTSEYVLLGDVKMPSIFLHPPTKIKPTHTPSWKRTVKRPIPKFKRRNLVKRNLYKSVL